MIGQQPKGRVGLGDGRWPAADGPGLAQAARRDAAVGQGGEAGLAKRVGMPAFVRLLVARDRVDDHDGGIAIAGLVGQAHRHGEGGGVGRRLARQELAKVRVTAGLDHHGLRTGRYRHRKEGQSDDEVQTHLSGTPGR